MSLSSGLLLRPKWVGSEAWGVANNKLKDDGEVIANGLE